MVSDLKGISYDTNVVSAIVANTHLGDAYLDLMGPHRVAITYFVRGELRAGNRSRAPGVRLEALLGDAEILPDPDEEMLRRYVGANRSAHELGLARGVGEDLWMIAQTVQRGLEFATHDRNAARVARAVGLTVHTLLPNINADYDRDDARLARRRERRS